MRLVRVAVLVAPLLVACTSAQPCPKPLEECGGQCVDVQSDRRYCGSCDNPCGAGLVCIGAACVADPNVACPDRHGGAFVTLGSAGAAVKLWIESAEFVNQAQALLAGTATSPSVPVLSVLDGTDCDAQWSWHVSKTAASFQNTSPSAACDVDPRAIESDVAAYVLSPGSWCPSDATILAVDVR